MSACSVHDSEVDRAETAMPDRYVEAGKGTAAAMPEDRWWTVFGDPVLTDLEERALSGNPDIYAAVARLEQARAVYREINAARFPVIGFQGESARSRTPSFFGDVTGGSYRLEFQAGYELDLWQKYKSASDAAGFDANASMEDVKGVYLSVAAEVASLYFIAVEQRAQMKMVNEIVRAARHTLSFVERRYRAGTVDAVDVYQARQTLRAAEARLPLHETQLIHAEHALSLLCGEFPEKGITGDSDSLDRAFAIPDIGVPAMLLRRRPDIRKAFQRLKAADARVASAVADLYPAFRIGGSIGRSQTLMTSSPIVGGFWNLFAGVTQPIFEGGRRVARVERSRAQFREAVAIYRKTVMNAVREVEDAMAACRGSVERIRRLEQWVSAASNALQLSGNRYFWGVSEYLPVLTAQAAELEAKSQLINARRVHISNFINLAKALGGGWMERMPGIREPDSLSLLPEEPVDK